MMFKSKFQILPILPNKSQFQNPKARIWIWDFGFILDLVVFVVLGFALNAYAQSISSAELINNAKLYDGKTVTYEGEVIGDVMARGEYGWINVNDNQNAIGVWLHQDLIKDILYTGNYKAKGDGVEITGIFHRACLEHGGDLDIHAQSMRKIRPGRPVIERLNPAKRNMVLVLLGVLCLVWILRLLKLK